MSPVRPDTLKTRAYSKNGRLVAVVEEQKHEVDGEEGKHEVDVPPEEPGPKVGTNVVAIKVG